MILTKEVEVKLWSNHVKYYLDLGYKGKHGDVITVKVEDLPRRVKTKVKVQCDYCGTIKQIAYADYLNAIEKHGRYTCNKCMYNTKQSTFSKYGVDNYSSTLECRKKVRNTCLEYYGVDNCAKSIKVREKINETLCKNGTQKTSKQQLYLCSIYGGELNYPISHYATDICFPKEKLIIEYDGGGHDLSVRLGKITQEEFNQKEIIRNSVLKKEGYKQMRIISSKDLLPQDSILLQMLSDARNYFSNYPNHSWIEFNIDTSTIRSAEYKDGVYYDYGNLRTIKDVA